MKRVRLTALAEFDLVEAQDFYARDGAWVLDRVSSIEQLICKRTLETLDAVSAGLPPRAYLALRFVSEMALAST